jgi:hypothetical protein
MQMDDRTAIQRLLGLWLAQAGEAPIDALVNRPNIERVKRGLPTTEIARFAPRPKLRLIQGGRLPAQTDR